jgi:hypothetical protein
VSMTTTTPNDAPAVIAVWPCTHGDVLVEPGKALPGYRCYECGATARTYVAVDHLVEFLDEPGKPWGPYPAAAARVREEWGA